MQVSGLYWRVAEELGLLRVLLVGLFGPPLVDEDDDEDDDREEEDGSDADDDGNDDVKAVQRLALVETNIN